MPEEERELSTGARCVVRGPRGGVVGVVALHPWGPMGGSLDDPHVRAVTQFFGKGGCATCRVQFRSGFGRGEGSVADAVAAAEALLSFEGVRFITVVGYSYGSCVAMRAEPGMPTGACGTGCSFGGHVAACVRLRVYNVGGARRSGSCRTVAKG